MLSVEHGFFGKTLSFSSTVFAFLLYQFVFINDLPACPVVRNFVPLENCILILVHWLQLTSNLASLRFCPFTTAFIQQ